MTVVTTPGGGFYPFITEVGGEVLVAAPQLPLFEIIPAYPYQEYADDPNIVAFFDAYNTLAQQYLAWFNNTALGVYTSPHISGQLLDWIGQGLYGLSRPVFASTQTSYTAGMNSMPMNTTALNGHLFSQSGTATVASDDYYKRYLTWYFYLGDGQEFNPMVLRAKVARWLYCPNGSSYMDPNQIDLVSDSQAIRVQPLPLAAPSAPTLTSLAGGALAGATYNATVTDVTPVGETTPSSVASLAVGANNLLRVASPPYANGATGYNVYVGTTGSRTKQNATPIAFGTNWTEPTSGLISGSAEPGANTSNSAANIIITIPSSVGDAATFFQQAYNQGILPIPFQLSASVVIR